MGSELSRASEQNHVIQSAASLGLPPDALELAALEQSRYMAAALRRVGVHDEDVATHRS